MIVGAGAAGLMAAIFAADGPRPVLLLEGSERPGQKILISGGGRCNVLPSLCSPSDFVSDASPHLVAKILRAWPLEAVRRFFEEDLEVPLRLEAETGKLFPVSNRARDVLDALLTAAHRRGVQLRLGARMTDLVRGDTWQVGLGGSERIAASRVVLATGGLSVPATGSDGAGLNVARALGHTVVGTYPGLVPLTTGDPAHHALAGLSLPVRLTAVAGGGKRVFETRGGFLFTHRGYSGPAVLNISHVAVRSTFTGGARPAIHVAWTDLSPDAWVERLRAARGLLLPLLRGHLPERLAVQLLQEAGLLRTDVAQLRRDERRGLVELLTRYRLPWSGHEGYRVAEVTGGGVSLAEVDPASLESRVAPGLYLCGEMLDAFGPIGGYNFLWGWVTGRIAGLSGNQA